MYKNTSAQQNPAVTTESISVLTGKHEIPISSKKGLYNSFRIILTILGIPNHAAFLDDSHSPLAPKLQGSYAPPLDRRARGISELKGVIKILSYADGLGEGQAKME